MTLAVPALLARNPEPMPWRVDAVAERAIALLNVGFETRSVRLRPALARPPAYNRIAVDRLFSACESALRPEIEPLRHLAVRHHALVASALTPLRPQAANDNEPPGIVVQRLLCLAGKRLDWREIGTVVEVGRHALGRFVQRSGRETIADIHGAVLQAAEASNVVLLAHCDRALGRLAGGVAAVLLPAGNGAFLGHLRLLPGRAGQPVPVAEAQTWLHSFDLREGQKEVWEVLTSGLPTAEKMRHLSTALRWLLPATQGDRRIIKGMRVIAPGQDPGRDFRMALGVSQPAALARLHLGLACADTIAAERRCW